MFGVGFLTTDYNPKSVYCFILGKYRGVSGEANVEHVPIGDEESPINRCVLTCV